MILVNPIEVFIVIFAALIVGMIVMADYKEY